MQRSALLYLSLGLALLAPTGCGKKSSTTPAPVVANAQPEPAEPATPTEPAEPAAGGKATPSDAELEALFTRSLDFFDALANAVASNETDCKKMATAMTGVFDSNKALLAEAKSYEGNAEVDAKADAFMEKNKARLEGTMSKMMKGMQACNEDPDVQAAMERFDAM